MGTRPPEIGELRGHPLLESLPDERLQAVARHTRLVRLAPGEMLFRQGEHAGHFFRLRAGHLKLFRVSPDGHEKVVEIINPGQGFAEAVMFMEQRRYPVNAEALEDTEVLAIHSDTVLEILRESPALCLKLLGTLSRHLRQRLSDIDALSLQNAGLRVANFLLTQQRLQGSDEIELPAAKKIIAARLSIQPETLSRVLSQLEQKGAIRVEGRRIRLLDSALLEAVGG